MVYLLTMVPQKTTLKTGHDAKQAEALAYFGGSLNPGAASLVSTEIMVSA